MRRDKIIFPEDLAHGVTVGTLIRTYLKSRTAKSKASAKRTPAASSTIERKRAPRPCKRRTA